MHTLRGDLIAGFCPFALDEEQFGTCISERSDSALAYAMLCFRKFFLLAGFRFLS